MKNTRLALVSVVALVAAPLLAGCATTNPPGTSEINLTLKLGTMMPLTGALSDLGQDMQSGAKLAIKQINDAKIGLKITAFDEDDKTTDSAAAPVTFERLVGNGITGLAGPCCSGVTAAILDKAKDDQVVVASPSATSPALTMDRDNQGYFWRVSPSDAVQGKVLAKLVADDGVKTVNIIAVNNAYGTGLAKVFSDYYTSSLSGVVAKTEKINENTVDEVSSQVTSACTGAGTPAVDAIVLVVYIDQAAAILKEMNKQGCLSKVKVYGSEGTYKGNGPSGLPEKAGKDSAGKWLAAGMKGTNPESGDLGAFNSMFKAEYGHDPAQYSAESYDAVMYIALGAVAAKSVKGADIKEKMLSIANAPGTKYTSFKEAAQALLKGDDIDWKGQAHDFEFDNNHEPKTGIYSYWAVGEDGQVTTIATGKTV